MPFAYQLVRRVHKLDAEMLAGFRAAPSAVLEDFANQSRAQGVLVFATQGPDFGLHFTDARRKSDPVAEFVKNGKSQSALHLVGAVGPRDKLELKILQAAKQCKAVKQALGKAGYYKNKMACMVYSERSVNSHNLRALFGSHDLAVGGIDRT